MAVSLKTDLRFPESGQHGHGSRIIHREIRNRRIITAKIWKAAFFKSMKEAEKFTEKHLWYVGMAPQICYRGWVLISVESQEEQEQFWDGINPVLGNKNVSHR